MKKRRSLGLISTTLAVALSVAACGGGAASSGGSGGELKIGVIGPVSGPMAPGGVAIYEGYQLAVEEANADGGVLGRKVTLLKGDAATPEQGISEVNRLSTSEKVDAFAGTYLSSVANTASQTAQRYNKLYWDTNALATDLTERGLPNFVRSGPSASQFGKVSAESVEGLIAPELGASVDGLRVFITHEDSIYGSSVAGIQEELLKEAGATVVARVGYSAASADLTSVIIRGQEAKPDLWIQTGYVPDSSLLLRTAKQQNFRPDAIELVGTGDTDEFLEAVGKEQLEGVLVTGYPQPDLSPDFGPGAAEYLEAYKTKFGGVPNFPQTMAAYVGMQMMLGTIEEAGSTDPAKVRSIMEGADEPRSSYATGFGQKYDDEYQNTMALPTVIQWQGGKRVTVYPTDAVAEGTEIIPLG